LEQKRTPGRLYGLVFLTIFLDLLGFGIIIPIQPFYAEQFGATPTQVTWLGAAYSLMQFLFVPLWGRLSDRVGRRPVVLVSIAAAMVGFLLFGFAGSLGALFAARLVTGIGNANIATVQAILADITAPEERSKAMGILGAAFGLGFIIGPGVGGVVGSAWGPAAPAFVSAGLAAINWVYAYFVLPETHPKEKRGKSTEPAHRFAFGALVAALRRATVGPLLVLTFVTTISFVLMEHTLGLFIERVWVPEAVTAVAGSAEQSAAHTRAIALTTWVLVMVGVIATIIQGGLIGRLSKRFGDKRLIQAGLVITGLGMLGVPLAGNTGSYALLFVPSGLLAIGSALYSPPLNASLSRAVSDHEQGGIMGIGQSVSSLARVLGPAVAGAMFEITRDLPYHVGGIGLILAVVLSLRLRGDDASRG
jgi:MFS transporter, DHA1 family, tetracycline resistance protein